MKRITIIAAGLLMTFGVSYSQVKVNVGVSTAINSTFVLDKGFNADPSYTRVQSFEMAPFGFTFGTHFSNKVALSLEGILTNYSQIYEIKEKVQQAQQTANDIAEMNFDMQYLHLPMLLKFMGGGDNAARMNFSFGPQLSFLTSGAQTLALDPAAAGATMVIPDIPDGATIDQYIPGATDQGDGTFVMPQNVPTDPITLLSKDGGVIAGIDDQITAFKNQEFHILGAVGLDLDVSKNFYLSMNVKFDYSFTDMRNGELIEQLESGAALSDIFGNRANLAVGAQITINYMFGGTRSFLAAGL